MERSRPRNRLCAPRFLLSLLVASTLVACSVPVAFAGDSQTAWPFEWRPNWIPGDPVEQGHVFLQAPWTPLGLVMPGLIVALDPVSRLPIQPSPEQRAAAAAVHAAVGLDSAPDLALPVEHLPGGGEIVHLQERFQIFSVARRGADGRFTTSCVEVRREEK